MLFPRQNVLPTTVVRPKARLGEGGLTSWNKRTQPIVNKKSAAKHCATSRGGTCRGYARALPPQSGSLYYSSQRCIIAYFCFPQLSRDQRLRYHLIGRFAWSACEYSTCVFGASLSGSPNTHVPIWGNMWDSFILSRLVSHSRTQSRTLCQHSDRYRFHGI